MVAFNPPVLQCSKLYFPYEISTTTNIYVTTWQQASPVAWERERKKKEDSMIFFTSYYFSPFPWCVKKQPHDGVLLLCLLLSLFEWVHIFLAWKSGAQSWFKEKRKKKMKVYFVLYKCWEVLAIFFPVFFFLPLLKVAEVSINFYWNVLGVLWNAFTPTLPKVPGRMEGLKDIYPSSAFLLPPIPFPILRRFSWKEPVRTSRDGAVWIVGGEIRVLSKLFNVPFSVFTPLLYQVDPEANKSPLLMEQY